MGVGSPGNDGSSPPVQSHGLTDPGGLVNGTGWDGPANVVHGRERPGVNAGRRTAEAVEGQEAIVTHWKVISADGVITDVERISHEAVMGRQTWLLMAIDVWDKWATRIRRRGLDAHSLRSLQQDQRDIEQLRPRSGIIFDPYGAMAAE